MNARSHKTVFSKRLGALVAVGEHASSQGKATGESAGVCALGCSAFVGVLTVGFALVGQAWAGPGATALPTGGQVAQGQASISQAGAVMSIQQSTSKAVLNWNTFDIGQNAKVNITQPGADAVMLNRVTSANPSQILGQLNANGQVVLVNPNGVLFGKDGSVNATGFTASTLGITDANFMAGNNQFDGNGSTAAVVNQGSIKTTGGYVALLGASVSNEGQIQTQGGTAYLAAAETVKIPVSGSGRIKLELSPSRINAAVANAKGGTIVTEGGQVYMQAAALSSAVASIIQSGSIDSTGAQGGAVHLLADDGQITVDGSITANSTNAQYKGGRIVIGRDEDTGTLAHSTDVSGAALESKGGFIETSGHDLKIDNAKVMASNWLLDPDNIEITNSAAQSGYSAISASTLAAALTDGTSVTVNTTADNGSYNSAVNNNGTGKIVVTNAVQKTSGTGTATLNLIADDTITINNQMGATSGKLDLMLQSQNGISSSTSGAINTGGGTLTLKAINAAATGTLAGVISGSSKLSKTGAGTTILTGSNTYSGTTSVTAGTLQIGNGTSGAIGTGAITIDGASTVLKFLNPGSTQTSLSQTVTGNGTIQADKAIAFSGTISINKSAVDGNNTLTIKTTGADNGNIGGGRSINLNSNIVQAGADDVKLVVDSYSSLYANAIGSIGSSTAGLGKLDVDMTARGKDQSGNAGSVYSMGMSLSKVINANGGTVSLTAYESNINAGSGGASGALIFNNGSGITAGNFTVTGTYLGGNIGASRAGIAIDGTTNFTITGTGIGKFIGQSNASGPLFSAGDVGIYAKGTINLNSDNGQIKMEANTTRSEANINTKSLELGAVTLGGLEGNWFQRSGTITAQTGNLNIAGSQVYLYNSAASIKGSNSTIINLSAADVTLTSGPASGEGMASIGLASGATGFTLNINADKLNVQTNPAYGGTASTYNSGAGTTTIKNYTSGTTINIGGNDVAAAGATPATLGLTNAELNTFTAGKMIIGSSTAGNITVSSAVTTNSTTGDITLLTAGNIAVNAALSTGIKNLTLNALGASSTVTESANGRITAAGLELLGTNATYTLDNASNSISKLAGVAKSITVSNSTQLSVDSVNNTTGLTTSGDITLLSTTNGGNANSNTNSGIWVSRAINTTNGGNISITGKNTYSGSQTNLDLGVRIGANIGSSTAGAISITGDSSKETGIYMGAGLISSTKKLTLTGSGNLGVNLSGTGITSLAGGSDFAGANAIEIKGSGINNYGVLVGNTITNNSTGGATTVQSTAGKVFMGAIDNSTQPPTVIGSIGNASTAGAINILAGNGTTGSAAAIDAVAGFTVTQNANADVLLASDGQGNVAPAKIVKNGTGAGNIVIAAGRLIAAGTGAGGQIVALSGNTLTNNGTGYTSLYSGTASGTSDITSLVSGFTDTNGNGDLRLNDFGNLKQNAWSNTAYSTNSSSTEKTQVYFREKLSFSAGTLATGTITYGSDGAADIKAALKQHNSSDISFNQFDNSNSKFRIAQTALIDNLTNTSITSAVSASNSKSTSGHLNATTGNNTQSLNNLTATDYSVTVTAGVNVNKKTVTATGLSVVTKTYDGTQTADLTGSASLSTVGVADGVSTDSKVITGDKVALSGTAVGTYQSKNVRGTDANGTNNVTITGLSLTRANDGDDSGNYNFVQPAALVGKDTIQAKSITVTGISVKSKTYDGGKNASLNDASTVATVAVRSSQANDNKFLDGDNVMLSGTAVGTYDSKDVLAQNNMVTLSGKTLAMRNASNPDDRSNYVLIQQAQVDGTGTITPLALVGSISAVSTTYGTAASTGNFAFSNVVGNDAVTAGAVVLSNPVYSSSGNLKAGTYVQSVAGGLGGADAGNYSFSGTSSANYVVNKLALSTQIAGVSTVYGTSAATGAATISGVLAGDKVDLANAKATLVDEVKSGSGQLKVGTYKQTVANSLSGADADNYTAEPTSVANYVVTPKAITATVTAADKVYDGSNVATLTAKSADILSGDVVNVVGATGTFASKNVVRDAAGNVVAQTVTVSGTGVGLGGADGANYTLSNATSIASTSARITPKDLTVTGITASDKVYDGTTVASLSSANSQLAGVVAGDSVAVAGQTLTGNFASKNVAFDASGAVASQAVTVSGLSLSGADAGNYNVSDKSAATAKVLQRVLSITGSVAQDKTVDGGTAAQVKPGQLNNLVAGESLLVTATGQFEDAEIGTNKAVKTQYALANGSNSVARNYTLAGEVLRAAILAAVVNPVQPVVNPVKPGGGGRVVVAGSSSSGAALGVAGDEDIVSREECSILNPEKCECQESTVAGVELCFAPGHDADSKQ